MKKLREIRMDMDEVLMDVKESDEDSSIYVGCDSEQFDFNRVPMIVFATVLVIHHRSSNGGTLYKSVDFERDYGSMRQKLMNEVYRATGLAMQVVDHVGERPFQIHLDVNPDPNEMSSVVVKEATGYVLGTLGIEPRIKWNAFAASSIADRVAERYADKYRDRRMH